MFRLLEADVNSHDETLALLRKKSATLHQEKEFKVCEYILLV